MDCSDVENARLADLEGAILDEIRAQRGVMAALRERSRSTRLVALAILVAVEALFMFTYLRRGDWAEYPAWRMMLTAGGFAVGALFCGWVALRPMYRPPPRGAGAILAAALLLPFAVALLPALPTAYLPRFTYPGYAFRCFAYGACLAWPVILWVRALDRGGHAFGWAALAAAVAGGYAGLLGLQLECPVNDTVHLLTGHAIVPLGAALGCWLLLRRW
jgi:hypothetical protein